MAPVLRAPQAFQAPLRRTAILPVERMLAHQRLASVCSTVAMDRIVAIGLLTQRDVDLLGSALQHAWAVEDAPEFEELLRAIDAADETLQQRSEQPHGVPQA
jgi:hypothetical protein